MVAFTPVYKSKMADLHSSSFSSYTQSIMVESSEKFWRLFPERPQYSRLPPQTHGYAPSRTLAHWWGSRWSMKPAVHPFLPLPASLTVAPAQWCWKHWRSQNNMTLTVLPMVSNWFYFQSIFTLAPNFTQAWLSLFQHLSLSTLGAKTESLGYWWDSLFLVDADVKRCKIFWFMSQQLLVNNKTQLWPHALPWSI